MTERQAALTGWREYELRLKGKDRELQERWEVARWLAWQNVLLSPNIKAVNKPKTARAFCRFPWEEPLEEELRRKAAEYRVTPREIEELNRIFAEVEASRNKDRHVEDR